MSVVENIPHSIINIPHSIIVEEVDEKQYNSLVANKQKEIKELK
jgi:hypothetical protein